MKTFRALVLLFVHFVAVMGWVSPCFRPVLGRSQHYTHRVVDCVTQTENESGNEGTGKGGVNRELNWLYLFDTTEVLPSSDLVTSVGDNNSSKSGTGNGNSNSSNSQSSLVNEQMTGSWRPPESTAWRVAVGEAGEGGAKDSMHPPAFPDFLDQAADLALSSYHEGKVTALWAATKKSMSHLSKTDSVRVQTALRIAYVGLWGKSTHRTLDVSINRARGIACVLGELKADADVVIAGVLHEVVSEISFDDNFDVLNSRLVAICGAPSIELASKYVSLPKFLRKKDTMSVQSSENQIQMLVAMVEDYRALYIRLADRVATLRVLRKLPISEDDRLRIALEARMVYAPLAHKMGAMKLKGELEDLAFKVINPEAFQQTRYAQTAANKAYHEVADAINELITADPYLHAHKVRFHITYRIKDKYQLVLKKERKKLSSLSDVRDALGLRIVVDGPQLPDESAAAYAERGADICYYVAEKLRELPGWEPSPGPAGFKDYIRNSKANGYQSLHQHIRNRAHGTNVEVQVRTRAMHKHAELGLAAHWYYKDLIYRADVAYTNVYNAAWRAPEQVSNATTPAQLMGMAKFQLLKKRVFVVLDDKSTVLNLRRGSTALDAAFAIHSSLGLQTESVMVNGKRSRLSRPLQNGDIVQVRTSPSASQPLQSDESEVSRLAASLNTGGSFDYNTNAAAAAATAAADTLQPVPQPPVEWLDIVRTSKASTILKKHFRQDSRAAKACMGIIVVACMLELNAEVVRDRCYERLPLVAQLQRFADLRMPQRSLGDVLVAVGEAGARAHALNGGDSARIGKLFSTWLDIPEEKLTVVSYSLALRYIRLQAQHGWENEWIRDSFLCVLIEEALPAAGFERRYLEHRWHLFTGGQPLHRSVGKATPESPYRARLLQRLRSSKTTAQRRQDESLHQH